MKKYIVALLVLALISVLFTIDMGTDHEDKGRNTEAPAAKGTGERGKQRRDKVTVFGQEYDIETTKVIVKIEELNDETIPSQIGQLKNLKELMLFFNDLSGEIPPEIGDLTKLEELKLSDNPISGKIPPQIGRLRNLRLLLLGKNRFIGPIPRELGSLTQLEDLDLEKNAINGEIPPELGNLTQLKSLLFCDNELSGRIPPQLGNLRRLERINLGNNQLSGNIPKELGNLTQLKSLSLVNNRLTGVVPTELSNLRQLSSLELLDNEALTGPLVLHSSKLAYLYISNTNIKTLCLLHPVEECMFDTQPLNTVYAQGKGHGVSIDAAGIHSPKDLAKVYFGGGTIEFTVKEGEAVSGYLNGIGVQNSTRVTFNPNGTYTFINVRSGNSKALEAALKKAEKIRNDAIEKALVGMRKNGQHKESDGTEIGLYKQRAMAFMEAFELLEGKKSIKSAVSTV